MDAHCVEVFDGADDDGVVGQVAHHLHLVFLPTQDALLDQHFVDGGELQPAPQKGAHLFGVVGQSAARAAKREAGPEHDRIADRGREIKAVVDAGDEPRARAFKPDLDHRRLECLAILGLADRLEVGPD